MVGHRGRLELQGSLDLVVDLDRQAPRGHVEFGVSQGGPGLAGYKDAPGVQEPLEGQAAQVRGEGREPRASQDHGVPPDLKDLGDTLGGPEQPAQLVQEVSQAPQGLAAPLDLSGLPGRRNWNNKTFQTGREYCIGQLNCAGHVVL